MAAEPPDLLIWTGLLMTRWSQGNCPSYNCEQQTKKDAKTFKRAHLRHLRPGSASLLPYFVGWRSCKAHLHLRGGGEKQFPHLSGEWQSHTAEEHMNREILCLIRKCNLPLLLFHTYNFPDFWNLFSFISPSKLALSCNMLYKLLTTNSD